jgi:glycine cleavage system H lipoate-binding protein
VAFLKWVLTDGQEQLSKNGFCELVLSDRQSKIDMLDGNVLAKAQSAEISESKSILLMIAAFVVTGVLITLLIAYSRRKKAEPVKAEIKPDGFFNESTVDVPGGMYYDKTHTWVFMEKDGNLRIGIDDFLQHITGDLTRVKMKCQGDKIKKGENILTLIQNGKHLIVKSPVSGTVVSHNDLLLIDPATLNQSPYSEGWVYEIAPSNWVGEIQVLQMADAYRSWLKNEFTRVKDFLATTMKTNSIELSPIILQDGGELKDHVLTEFGPEVWEDFQTTILENV